MDPGAAGSFQDLCLGQGGEDRKRVELRDGVGFR